MERHYSLASFLTVCLQIRKKDLADGLSRFMLQERKTMAKITVLATATNTTKTTITAGKHSIIIDEPPLFGGADEAPSPVEMYLASIAGCINAAGQWIAKEMNMDLQKIDISIEGEVDGSKFLKNDDTFRAGFSEIVTRVRIVSDSEPSVQEAWLQQVRERCPVIDNTENGTKFIMK